VANGGLQKVGEVASCRWLNCGYTCRAFSAVVDSVYKHDALSHKTALRSVKVLGVQVRRVAKSPKVLFMLPLELRVQGRLARIVHSGKCSPSESGIHFWGRFCFLTHWV